MSLLDDACSSQEWKLKRSSSVLENAQLNDTVESKQPKISTENRMKVDNNLSAVERSGGTVKYMPLQVKSSEQLRTVTGQPLNITPSAQVNTVQVLSGQHLPCQLITTGLNLPGITSNIQVPMCIANASGLQNVTFITTAACVPTVTPIIATSGPGSDLHRMAKINAQPINIGVLPVNMTNVETASTSQKSTTLSNQSSSTATHEPSSPSINSTTVQNSEKDTKTCTDQCDNISSVQQDSQSESILKFKGEYNNTDHKEFNGRLLTAEDQASGDRVGKVEDILNTEHNNHKIGSNTDNSHIADAKSNHLQGSRDASVLDSSRPALSDVIVGKAEKIRPLRKSQRRGRSCDTVHCPVCRVAVRVTDITDHLAIETDRLHKWAQDYRKKQSRRNTPDSGSVCTGQSHSRDHKDRYQSFLRVKHNRQERGSSKSKRGSGTQCPVCNERISGNQYQLSQHVEKCLLKESADIDIEGGSDSDVASEGFEEYEWAGQTRIRATSLLPGSGLADSGFVVGKKDSDTEDLELDIEKDETDVYGQSQYNEADLIPCEADEPEEESGRQAIRDILLQEASASTSIQKNSQTSDKQSSEDVADEPGPANPPPVSTQNNTTTSSSGTSESCVSSRFRCLICMENYESPATSIQCWHVYCEECWLRTLGAKKLCPQCNAITHPSDLRRIYL